MTNRLTYKTLWAQGGDAKDPDLDTENPSFVANKYAGQGWVVQKPPEEWQNFLTGITDQKVAAMLESGLLEFDSSVVYKPGALITYNQSVYANTSGANTSAPPSASSPVWEQVLAVSLADYTAAINNAVDSYNSHLAASNPHNDTIENIGGVGKLYVDQEVAYGSNEKTIVWHMRQTGAVHNETPSQLGTLPTSGGVFTGGVVLVKKATVGSTASLSLSSSSGMLGITLGSVSLFVNSNGEAYVYSADGSSSQIISEDNFVNIDVKLNPKYSLPSPLIAMNLQMSLCDADSVGNWTITSSADPVFDNATGLYLTNNTFTTTGISFGKALDVTVFLSAYRGSANFSQTYNMQVTEITDFSAFIKSISPNSTRIRDFRIYPRLTTEQNRTLVGFYG